MPRGDGFAFGAYGSDSRLRSALCGIGICPSLTLNSFASCHAKRQRIGLSDVEGRQSYVSKLSVFTGTNQTHSTQVQSHVINPHQDADPLENLLLSGVGHDSGSVLSPGGLERETERETEREKLRSFFHFGNQNTQIQMTATPASEAPRYDFCNPELYDDPFGASPMDQHAAQTVRVTPAKYMDSMPRIQRSLSIKPDLANSFSGIHDPLAKSMEFNSLTNKSRQRIFMGIGSLPVDPSKKLFPSRLKEERISVESESHDSEVFPIGEASNMIAVKSGESDLPSIPASLTPRRPADSANGTFSPKFSPKTPLVLHKAVAIKSAGVVNKPIESLSSSRHTFRSLKPSQMMQFVNLYGRSSTFKSLYTGTLSNTQHDDGRGLFLRQRRPQQRLAATVSSEEQNSVLLPAITSTEKVKCQRSSETQNLLHNSNSACSCEFLVHVANPRGDKRTRIDGGRDDLKSS